MDTQKYYDCQNGVYCVYFPNRKGLSIEEITSIFAEFGDVVAVNKAGDDFGYRFVKYRNEDDAIKCVEGLRNHPSVTLKMKDPNHKKNKNQANNRISNFRNDQKTFENNGQKKLHDNNNRRPFEAPVAEKTAYQTENKTPHFNNNSPTVDRKNFSSEQRTNYSEGVTNRADLEPQKHLQEVRVTNFAPSKPATPLRQPKAAAAPLIPAKIPSTEVVKSSGKSSNNSDKSSKSKGSANKPVVTAKSSGAVPRPQHRVADEEVPRLVEKIVANGAGNCGGTMDPQAAAEPETVTAEEVVVANIHSDFGVHYILHLIQKHDPLSVSEMKIIPSLGLRYCIVYLQSVQQAYAIEKEFDRFQLSGKDLMVLRSQRLAELSV